MRIALAGALIVVPQSALAYFGLSGRTAGMGGTGVAIARGGEGIFYNPARTVTATSAELSLSANAYGIEKVTSEQVQSIDDGTSLESVDLPATSILSFPSAVSTIVPLGDTPEKHTLGFGLFVPFSPDSNAEAVFTPANHPTVRRIVIELNNREYWLTGSYALQLGPLALGAGLAGVITTERFRTNLSRTDPGFTASAHYFFTQYSAIDGRAIDLHATLGATLELGAIRLAAMARSPSINLAGTADFTEDFVTSDAQGNYALSVELENLGYANPKPIQLGFGLAVETGDFTLTVEGLLDLERTAKTVELREEIDLGRGNILTPSSFERASPLKLNLGAGLELAVSSSVKLRAGGFAIWGFSSFPSEDELAALNERFAMPAASAEEYMMRSRELDSVLNVSRRWSYAVTLGVGWKRETLETDLALTGVLLQGEGVRAYDTVLEGGNYVRGVAARDIGGYALILSIGGTYGIDGGER